MRGEQRVCCYYDYCFSYDKMMGDGVTKGSMVCDAMHVTHENTYLNMILGGLMFVNFIVCQG